jgi:hypothetical protein
MGIADSAREAREAAQELEGAFGSYREALRAQNKELGAQVSNIKQASSLYSQLDGQLRKLQNQEEGISRLTDKQLSDVRQKANEQVAEIQRRAKALADERGLAQLSGEQLQSAVERLANAGRLTQAEQSLLLAKANNFDLEEESLALIEKELAIREEANRLLGITGGALKTINGLLGPFASAFNLDAVEAKMSEVADEIARGERSGNKLTVALAGAGEAASGLVSTLMDPAVIIGGIVSSFAKFEEQNRKVRQLTGQSAASFKNVKTSLEASTTSAISLIDATKTIGELSQEIGINVNAAFSPNTIVAATELSELLGLSAQETATLALRAEAFGEDLGAADDQAEAIVKNFALSGKGALNVQQVLKGAGSASASLSLSIKGGQKGLLEAAANAQRLGINLQQAEQIADSLLDFEQSISNELEAELLTGRSLNLEKARTAALNNDIATLTEEIGNNEGIMEAFSSGNRIQQDAIAKSLGMSKDQVANMIFLKQKEKNLTDEQAAAAAGISVEEAKRLSATESINKSIEQLTAAFAPLLDTFAKIVASDAGMMAIKVIVASLAAASVVKGVFGLSKSFAELGSNIKGALSGMGSFLKTAKGAGGGVQGIKAGVKDALGMGGDAAKKAADATKGAAAGGAKQGQGAKGFLKGLGDGLASIGKQMANVVKGGLALGIVGVILGGSFALAMKMVENVDPVQMIAFAGALAIFGGTAALVGKLSSQIIQGSVALLALGVGLLGAGLAFSLIEGVDVKAMTAFSIILPLLALAAAGLGTLAPFILAGSAALAALGLALIPAALGFSMIQGVDMESVISFASGIGVLAATTAALGLASPLILLGSVALTALGLAMMPLAMGFQAMDGANTEGLVQSLATFAGLAPAMGLMAASLFGVAGGLGAMAVAGIAALPIVTALAGLGTVATGIAGIFGGGEEEEAEVGGTSTAAMEAKLDELNQNMSTLIATVREGGVVNIDGNKAGTFFAMGASKLA